MGFHGDYDQMSNEALFAEYKRTQDQKIKQELVLRYVHIVRSVAMQMRGVYLGFSQIDDIINEGVLVIMSSIDKFDINRNVKFETYIAKRIRGLIIDIARKQDWVPRQVRKSAKSIEEAQSVLYERLGRYPTDKEAAEYLNISEKKYKDDLGKTNMFNILSLDMLLEDDNPHKRSEQMPDNSSISPEMYLQKKETAAYLKKGLESLRENEKLVLSLYYIKELNMREIAVVLKVSEPRVSQIHANALRKLKIYMEKMQADRRINKQMAERRGYCV